MKIKKLLKLQSVIENRAVPCDMTDNIKYWSRTKGDWVSILDMDLVHVVRALNLESNLEVEKHKNNLLQKIKNNLTDMEENV
tara:strand:+ start:1099 stop:1344 length:246 start_codon:yes stop_codon:yes gene_type:complete